MGRVGSFKSRPRNGHASKFLHGIEIVLEVDGAIGSFLDGIGQIASELGQIFFAPWR
jgi:hypothetical protein